MSAPRYRRLFERQEEVNTSTAGPRGGVAPRTQKGLHGAVEALYGRFCGQRWMTLVPGDVPGGDVVDMEALVLPVVVELSHHGRGMLLDDDQGVRCPLVSEGHG